MLSRGAGCPTIIPNGVVSMGARKGRSQPYRRSRLPSLGSVLCLALALAVAGCGGSSRHGASSSDSGSSTGSSDSGSPTGSGSTPKLTSTTPAAPGSVASVTWDLPSGEPTTVDPAKSGDFSPDLITSNLCDDLLRLQPSGSETPEIAQSYDYANPRTLVLNIRSGVKFWDGHPLTAADVAFSLQRTASVSSGSIYTDFFTTVRSIDQTGPYQVTVHFKTPDELLLKEMATALGGVVEKAYTEKVGSQALGSPKTKVMCSGPYELKSWSPGQQLVLTKNPHYWDPAIDAKVKTVTVKFLTDTSAITSALISGEIDGAYGLSAQSIPALLSTSAGKLYFGTSLNTVDIQPTGSGVLENPAVRRALGLTIDRPAIAKRIYSGAAVPLLAIASPPTWTPGSAKSIYQAGYNALQGATPNIAEAKKLMAGIKGTSKPITLGILGGDQTSINLAAVIQQEAAQIGLHIQIDPLSALAYSNALYVQSYRKEIDAMLDNNNFYDIPDELDQLIYFLFPYPQSTSNFIHYNNTTVANDLAKARETLDPLARARYLVQAQAIYMGKDEVIIPVVEPYQSLFLNNRLRGATTSFAYLFEPAFAYLGGR